MASLRLDASGLDATLRRVLAELGEIKTRLDRLEQMLAEQQRRPAITSPSSSSTTYYRVDTAAEVSSLSRTTLYRLMKEGKIERRKVGRRTVITAASLHAHLNGTDAYESSTSLSNSGGAAPGSTSRSASARLTRRME
jgi:excisionase family DNA binding protein